MLLASTQLVRLVTLPDKDAPEHVYLWVLSCEIVAGFLQMKGEEKKIKKNAEGNIHVHVPAIQMLSQLFNSNLYCSAT